MRLLLYIIQKEFKQIFRNKGMLPLLIVMPVMQLLILSNAASFDIKNIKIAIVDHDHSKMSRELQSKFSASPYFNVTSEMQTAKQADIAMQEGTIDVILEFPYQFEQNLMKDNLVHIPVRINAIDGATAGVENVYITEVIRSFSQNILMSTFHQSGNQYTLLSVEPIPSFWYNKTLNYKTYMVPGILVLLVTMLTLFLSAMNIVREKEIGTLEQINVTPIKKYQFIIGKLFPFWVIGLVVLTIGLLIAKLVFNVPIVGNIALVYLFTALYLFLVLGLGLFISNNAQTQQQAMFVAWFFMVIFILMSGLFTPIDSMPVWAQKLTLLNPIRYFVEMIRMVMLKGAGLKEIQLHLVVIVSYAFVVNVLSVLSYKKVN
ncbi:ABC transporter permease [Flavobacterium sediminis]|uniref:ABC transporter permease n=1 Tax=Flavobacterium sediminis TaxID=2201181 RepID=A0A2U8QSW2_9FLAO|nr:ABC transporter permease [Flavobacterium sediminis]AWM12935.1 ABC transporter permease [Flavobacterium sediminis]